MLVLISSMSLDRNVQQQQDRAMTLLRAKGISFETIDGAQAVNKERRNDLFAMSGLRGKYPQFFLVHPQAQTRDDDDGESEPVLPTVSFFADWDKLEAINDASSLPDDILKDRDNHKAIPPLYGALLKNEQDVHLLERLAFMNRRDSRG